MPTAMKKEYNFSQGERGKFYQPDMQLHLPVYSTATCSAP
jgi:hypothetical protein